MKRLFTALIIFILSLLYIAGVQTVNAESISPCVVTPEESCDVLHVNFLTNNTGTTFEVRYKYYYKTSPLDTTFGDYPATRTKSVMVNNGTTSVPNITAPRAYHSYYVKWGTTCVDPEELPDGYDNYNQGLYNYYWNINIDPRDAPSSQRPKGDGQNLGTVYWTGGNDDFVPGSTAKCFPCTPDNTCSASQCGIVGNGCGGTKNCGGCPGTQVCSNKTCIQNFGCRLNDNGNPVCAQKQCQLGNTDCYATNDCGSGCSGGIGGKLYIDGKANGKENNQFDAGEGYTRNDNSPDLEVQRGTINNGTFNVKDRKIPDPDYNFGGLLKSSDHDIRVINFKSARLNLETDNPRRNINVPNSNVSFRFSFKKFRVFGKVWWDPNGIPGDLDDRPYVNQGSIPGKIVRVCVVGSGCDDTDPGGTNAGEFNITGVPTNLADAGARYTVRVSDFKAVHNVENNSQIINIKTDNQRVDFYITTDGPPVYDIGGTVYLDDGDRVLDPGTGTNRDQPYKRSRARIELDPSTREGFSNRNNGKYNIPDNPAGTYTATLTSGLSAGFAVVPGLGVRSVTVGPNRTNVNFLVERVGASTKVITGGIFIDENGNGVKDCIDPNDPANCTDTYLAPNWSGQRVTLNPGNVSKNGPDAIDGNYAYDTLTGSSYTVNLSRTGVGYTRTYPSLDTYTITNLGNSATCSVTPASSNAECTATGDVVNADFGITPSALPAGPWIQGTGGDMRSDQGFDVTIPSGQYMSITSGTLASPGIIFNFDVNGNFSTRGWHADDNGYGGRSIKTSYTSVKNALTRAGSSVYDFFGEANSPCTGTVPNCALGASEAEGFFQHTGDVNLTAVSNSFTAGRDYIFLVQGNLNINSNITIPPGATAMFVASGNITVNGAVTNIEGIYSADADFIVLVSPSNAQLTVGGSVIGNALSNAANTTPFINNRTMGSANDTTPSVRFIYRPDFVLNAPSLIKGSNYNFTEVAPPGTKP